MDKPDCYKCKHKGDVPGSVHSSCQHPEARAASSNHPMGEAMAILASIGRVAPVIATPEKMKVVGHPHGIANGWFNWPYNFDPTWLQECSEFEPRKQKESAA